MNKLLFIIISVILGYSCEKHENGLPEEQKEELDKTVYPVNQFQVGGYLREGLIEQTPDDIFEHLTHLYLIGGVYADKDLIVKFNDKVRTKETVSGLIRERGDRNTRIILSVAGKFQSTVFLFAKDSSNRAFFVKILLDFCLENGLDGIDMDVEHPETAEEVSVMKSLSKDLFEAFHPEGLSVSHAIVWYNTRYAGEVLPYLDWINLMLYDVFDAKGVHATFELFERDILRFKNAGIPGKKITAGLPFYGVNVTSDKTKRKQIGYKQLIGQYGNNPFKPSADLLDGIWAINGVETIEKKSRYAAENNLNGVMFWSLALDFETKSDKSLLKSILSVTPVKTR